MPGERQRPIRTASNVANIVDVLSVIFPETYRTYFIPAPFMQCAEMAARTPIGRIV